MGLVKALTNKKPLRWSKRRDRYLIFPNFKHVNDPLFAALMKEMKNEIFGQIPQTSIHWIIAIQIELQKKLSKFFVVVSPTVIATKSESAIERLQIAPFIKEATLGWYNEKYSRILDLWLDVIFDSKREITVNAFDENITGFNAQFKIERSSPHAKKS